MTGSTASDQAKTSEERIEQHLSHLSSTASRLELSVFGIEPGIRSFICGPVFVAFISCMSLAVMFLMFAWVYLSPDRSGDLMTVDSSIHALERRLAHIEILLENRPSDSRLGQQLIRIEGVLRERLPLRQ